MLRNAFEKARLKTYQKKLVRAFEADDIKTVASMGPPLSSWCVAEMAFHKAREAHPMVSAKKRAESLKWLKERGLKTMRECSPPM